MRIKVKLTDTTYSLRGDPTITTVRWEYYDVHSLPDKKGKCVRISDSAVLHCGKKNVKWFEVSE